MPLPMTDPSDQAPIGGYIFGLLPPGYFRDAVLMQAVCAGLDTDFENRRVALDQLHYSRYIDYATGADLDAIGQSLNIGRYTTLNEGDDAYRRRIKATARNGVGAATAGTMPAALSAAFGVPFVVQNGAIAATITIFAMGPLAVPQAVMPYVKQIKLAGVIPTAYQRLAVRPKTGASTGLVGTSQAGTTVVGGAGYLIPLQ